MFQGTVFADTEMRKLVENINAAVAPEDRRGPEQIDTLFPMLWSQLEKPVSLVMQNAANASPAHYEELTSEMMALLRQQNTVLSDPEKFFAPVAQKFEQRLRQLEIAYARAATDEAIAASVARKLGGDKVQAGARAGAATTMTVAEVLGKLGMLAPLFSEPSASPQAEKKPAKGE